MVIPFDNPGLFLSEAIESVFAQIYDDSELLLIDDRSRDRSTDGGARLGRPSRFAHALSVPSGALQQRRERIADLGWRSANGGLVAFVDADDLWLPDKLNDQIELSRAHPPASRAE
jgi:glycosyltransferase involved in cell wall biosynthesis